VRQIISALVLKSTAAVSASRRKFDVHELQLTVVRGSDAATVLRVQTMNVSRTVQARADIPLAAAVNVPFDTPLCNLHPVMFLDALGSGLASTCEALYVLQNTAPGMPEELSSGLELLALEYHFLEQVVAALKTPARQLPFIIMEAITRNLLPVFPTTTPVQWQQQQQQDSKDADGAVLFRVQFTWPIALLLHGALFAAKRKLQTLRCSLFRQRHGSGEVTETLALTALPRVSQDLAFTTPWQKRLTKEEATELLPQGKTPLVAFDLPPKAFALGLQAMKAIGDVAYLQVTPDGAFSVNVVSGAYGTRVAMDYVYYSVD
jgi:hypothetical protein